MTSALPGPGDRLLLDRVLDGAGRRPWAVLIALCLVLWLPGFFSLPATDRDESRFAQASKQMVETGDYVRIRNGLVARNQKPVGIYWLQAASAASVGALGIAPGNTIWPYRLPSLVGALVAVLATYGFGRRLVAPPAALLGAALLGASFVLTVEVHLAKTDAALLGATTVAMGVLSRAWRDPGSVRRPMAWLFWAALGVAVLVKGPIAPMVCVLTVLWLAVAGRRQGAPRWLWALRPCEGSLLLLAIVLPWCIAIGIATHGRFFAQSVGGDLAGKLAAGDDAHGAPFGTHLLLLPLLGMAAGVGAACALPSVWRARREPATQFLIAWIVPSWLVFEIVATKLPHYTLPLYPALALLAARWLLAPGMRPGKGVGCAGAMAVMGAIGLAALALPFVASPGIAARDLLGVPVLLVAGGTIWLQWRAWPDPRRAVLAMLCAAPLLYGTLLGVELPRLGPLWLTPRIAIALARHWPDGPPVGAALGELGYAEPSLMFVCGTGTRIFNDGSAAAAFLGAHGAHVLVVNDRDLPSLTRLLQARGLVAETVATVRGFNYSRGQRMRLSLLAAHR